MDQELRELFDLRWKERNRVLGEEFLRIKGEMNDRGVLNSSMTIQTAHKLLGKEFEKNRQLISATIIDFIGKTQRVTSVSRFKDFAQAELASRKSSLENQFASGFKNVLSGLQNSAMIAPFANLNDVFLLAQQKLSVELNNAVVSYNNSFGSNLTDQLRNRLLNHPVIVVVVLSVAGTTFIIGLLKLLGLITFGQ